VSLLRLRPEAVEQVARGLHIIDHATGATAPWVPNSEQVALWQATAAHPWVFAAKPRQIGATTAAQLDDMLWAKVNDIAGNRVRCGLYVDVDKKLDERVAFARMVVQQCGDLFAGVDVNSERILFPGGSVVVLGTGSGSSEGRSGSFQRLHLSELPFWKNPDTFGSLLPSLSLSGQLVVETTLDVQAPNGILARNLWQDPTNRFHRLFFGVESHLEYRLPADRITDEEWALAQKEGFTIREAAAWWLSEALPNKVAGDMARLMREYPQTTGHMLSTASGLWVKRPSAVVAPLRILDVEGHALHIYREPAETSGQLVIGVDVAKGAGADASVIAVVDKRDERLVAMLHDRLIRTPPLARAVRVAADLYTRHRRSSHPGLIADPPPQRPDVVVETNGVGTGPLQLLHEAGVGAVDLHLAGAEGRSVIYTALLLAGQAAEAGVLAGPAVLAEECSELHRHPVTGEWKGRKDGLVAYGHAVRWARLHPYREGPTMPDPDVVDEAELIRRMMGSGRSRIW
jgi:hypothetical protein